MDKLQFSRVSSHKSHSFIVWLNSYCASDIRDIFQLKDSSFVPGLLQYSRSSDEKLAAPYLLTCNSEDGFIEASAQLLFQKISERLDESYDSIALVGLSGGTTPLKIFKCLSGLGDYKFDTSRVYIFAVDERYTTEKEVLNSEMIRKTLLSIWQLPDENVIFPDTNLPLDECIEDYQKRLGDILEKTEPLFVTLGLGLDGHIASLFPDYIKNFSTEELLDKSVLVMKAETDKFTCRQRISVTLPVLASAKTKIFFIRGEDKHKCWKEMTKSPLDVFKYPATYLFTEPSCICVYYPDKFRLQSPYSNYTEKDFLSVVIFGSNGNLSRRYLFPALFHLFYCGLLPDNFKIVCATRSRISFDDYFFIISDDIFSSILTNIYMRSPAIRFDFPTYINEFKRHCAMLKLVYDGSHITMLGDYLNEIERGYDAKRLFYLATPSNAYKSILRLINCVSQNFNDETRVLLEKPFGRSLSTCNELIDLIRNVGNEDDYFLVDHYIGKAVIKLILYVRSNKEYSHLFNNDYIKSIHIELLEDVSIENRPYFENYGIIRDMLQNHAMILLSYLTLDLDEEMRTLSSMSMRSSFSDLDLNSSNRFIDNKMDLLKAIRTVDIEDVVVGQYTSDGFLLGFKDSLINPENEKCPTFATIKMSIDNFNWRGVPVVITAGKALRDRIGKITVTFNEYNSSRSMQFNKLIFEIQPKPMAYWIDSEKYDEESPLSTDRDFFSSKHEDTSNMISLPGAVYEELMKPISGAYENVLLNSLWGNKHLFPSMEEVVECWRIFDKLLIQLEESGEAPYEYVRGSSGPKEKELIQRCLK